MANRTTAAKVGSIVDMDSTVDVEAFIEAANQIVTDVCISSGYTDAKLIRIETWLAAHFYLVYDPAAAPDKEKAGSVSISYLAKIGFYFRLTRHGQMAMALDTEGNLSQLNKRMEDGEAASVEMFWPGVDYNGS